MNKLMQESSMHPNNNNNFQLVISRKNKRTRSRANKTRTLNSSRTTRANRTIKKNNSAKTTVINETIMFEYVDGEKAKYKSTMSKSHTPRNRVTESHGSKYSCYREITQPRRNTLE